MPKKQSVDIKKARMSEQPSFLVLFLNLLMHAFVFVVESVVVTAAG